MQFRLLGPLEVVDGDRSLALGGRKQRSLLAVLLLHANDVLSTELLVDEVWGGSPPATVAKSVQVYVSRLRKELGDGRLVTRSPGYLLRVEPSELDLARFQALVTEASGADPAAAAAKLREALGLWRGPPLADLAYEPFAQSHVARLEDLRFTALEQRIEADLASGEHARLTGELEALVAQHPLRERLHGQLMLALYRSGRQAEALAAYQTARATLVDELGIEPGRELRDLHEAILRQDPGLDLALVIDEVAVPARRSVSVFVGRERELEVLGDALEDALAGCGRLVLIAGEPGIGKSRLTDELIGRGRDRGARILVGRCWEAGGAPAYWPWVQALRAYLRETEPDALSAQVRTGAAQLAALLPELRELLGDLPEPAAPDSDGARFLLFDAVSSFVSAAAQARPLVLVLDDVHAADEPSLLLLRFVAREIAASRLLIVCAYRDVDPTVRDPLASTLAAVVREPHTTQVALGGLSERDVEEYLELTTGSQPARELVAALHAETDGNALFVAEVVSLLDAEGRLDDVDAAVAIPPGVRAVIGQRLARLAEPCRDLLESASVLGREFDLQGLAALSGFAGAELLDVLDGAVAERVVSEVPRSPGRLRFGHALIRDTLYDELPPARRLRLHGQAGEALENVYRADVEPHLAELARHFFAAAPSGPPGKALAYARRAGDRAASQLAHEEAARHYEMALTLSEEPSARCELLLALGDARARAGATDASKAAFLQAADLAEAHGLPDRLGKAALGYGGRLIWDVSRDDERIVPLLERAIEAQGDVDSAMLVRLLSRLAGGPLRDARFGPQRKVALSATALDMARRLADPATLAHALHASINSQHGPDHTRRNLELAAELVDVSSRAGETERIVEGHEELLDAHLELGDVGAAKLELAAMEELARALRQPSQDWLVTVYRAVFELLEGRFDDAERSVGSASHLGERAQSWNAAVTYRLQLYVLRREQGRLAEVESLVRQSVVDYPTYPIWRCVFAQTEVSVGLPEDARDVLAGLGQDRFAALPVDEEWLVSACLLAEAASALTDVERASVLYELLLPFADRVALSPPEISIGAVARYVGLLAATIGRHDDARRHFADAIEINGRIGARPWLARTQDDLEAVLAAARGA